MTKTIVTGNFKGGVGKTTNAVMIAYTLSKQNEKVLLVDLDPQANATELLFTTMQQIYNVEPFFDETLETALINHNLEPAIVNVRENLDLLPSYEDLQGYEDFLNEQFNNDKDKDSYFASLLAKIRDRYDYIILDVPPQLNRYTDSALVACNYVVIVLQTQQRSLTGAETYVNHLLQIKSDYNLNLDLLGVLPVLLQNGNALDIDILQDAVETFGEQNLFKLQVRQMARLKRFDRTGITEKKNDYNDRRVHDTYGQLVNELKQRISEIEG